MARAAGTQRVRRGVGAGELLSETGFMGGIKDMESFRGR